MKKSKNLFNIIGNIITIILLILLILNIIFQIYKTWQYAFTDNLLVNTDTNTLIFELFNFTLLYIVLSDVAKIGFSLKLEELLKPAVPSEKPTMKNFHLTVLRDGKHFTLIGQFSSIENFLAIEKELGYHTHILYSRDLSEEEYNNSKDLKINGSSK